MTTAYQYGICNKTSLTTKARVSGTIIGGDPRFKHWLFPLWQANDLYNFAGVASAIFLEPHSWAGTRSETIEKILIEGNILTPHLLGTLSSTISSALPSELITTHTGHGGQGGFTDVVQLGADGMTAYSSLPPSFFTMNTLLTHVPTHHACRCQFQTLDPFLFRHLLGTSPTKSAWGVWPLIFLGQHVVEW